MGQSAFPAIRYPERWPPPDLPPFPPHPLAWIPVFGSLFRYFRWLRYSQKHQPVLDRIAGEIISQLETRPDEGPWPSVPDQRLFAQIVSDAVYREKGLTHRPALHPNDPFPLLFWGGYDDITPMIVRIESLEKLKLEVPDKLIMAGWNQRWTIQQFTEQLLAKSAG